MKISIIGAGYFGCHLALVLKKKYDITLFERSNEIFKGASGSNQNRLHLGYHYPRSWQTRKEIAETHRRFLRKYPTLKVKNNFFAVANESWIDLPSYTHIIEGDGLPNDYAYAKKFGITNVEGDYLFKTKERVIDTLAIKQMFQEELAQLTKLNTKADIINQPYGCDNEVFVNGEIFDACIDCTGGELKFNEKIFFEPAVLTVYDGPEEHFALTVMDGHFPCLYPTAEKGVWRVSHVAHTARGAFDRFEDAAKVLTTLDPVQITNDMTAAMKHFYPKFDEVFKPRYELVKAVRTKLKNNNASRECRTNIDGRIFRVFSGKICAVFLIEDMVVKWLKTLS